MNQTPNNRRPWVLGYFLISFVTISLSVAFNLYFKMNETKFIYFASLQDELRRIEDRELILNDLRGVLERIRHASHKSDGGEELQTAANEFDEFISVATARVHQRRINVELKLKNGG